VVVVWDTYADSGLERQKGRRDRDAVGVEERWPAPAGEREAYGIAISLTTCLSSPLPAPRRLAGLVVCFALPFASLPSLPRSVLLSLWVAVVSPGAAASERDREC
jgi:hypothetical protein